jgi:outer membrane receptor protein involved in Fe transport
MGAATPSCTGDIKLNQYNLSPKFNLSYTFDDGTMVYGNVSNGSRPGGGDAIYPTTGAVWGPAFAAYGYSGNKFPTTYRPDTVWSYEVGEKTRLFDNRLTLDGSIYYEDWTNIQLEAYPDDFALNINGNYAKIYGADISADANLGGGFDVKASGGYLHQYLNGGPHWIITPSNVLPEITPWQADLILSYATELSDKYSFTAQAESSYYGEHYSITFGNFYETNGHYTKLPGYALANLRFGIQSTDGWAAALFANNLTNTHAQLESMFTENQPTSAFNRIMTNQPLTVGIDLTYRTN